MRTARGWVQSWIGPVLSLVRKARMRLACSPADPISMSVCGMGLKMMFWIILGLYTTF